MKIVQFPIVRFSLEWNLTMMQSYWHRIIPRVVKDPCLTNTCVRISNGNFPSVMELLARAKDENQSY